MTKTSLTKTKIKNKTENILIETNSKYNYNSIR